MSVEPSTSDNGCFMPSISSASATTLSQAACGGRGVRCAATMTPGVDQTTLVDVEQYGVSRLLGELAAELKAGVYHPEAGFGRTETAVDSFGSRPDCDRRLLALLRSFLRAGVMEEGSVRCPVTGSPQGGVVSRCSPT